MRRGEKWIDSVNQNFSLLIFMHFLYLPNRLGGLGLYYEELLSDKEKQISKKSKSI